MFGYYLDLALRSLKRHKALTALMVVAIALGIGASMTMITVLHVLTADPLPGRSAQLFYPQIERQGSQGTYGNGQEPPTVLTWPDAMSLLHDHEGVRQAAMSGGQVTVVPPQGVAHAFFADARYTTADFFPMFGVPFVDGGGWTAADDDKHARVAVIARALADKLYGTPHAVGRLLRLGKYDFQVIGVVDRWNPQPHFYDLNMGNYAKPEQVYLPLQTAMELKQSRMGSRYCWGDMPADGDLRKAAKCAWMQYWVQLNTPAQVAAYRDYLIRYQERGETGKRKLRPVAHLHDLMGWLDYNQVVPGSVQLQTLLALGFLLVCLVNTVALLLVKFLRRGPELSVRRAMGASRRAVFAQLLAEAGLIGMAGGVAGGLLTVLGLWVVRQQPAKYAALAHLDGAMLVATLVFAVSAALLSALFPAWRACRLPPARLLKIQ